jgi:signal peptidase II
LGRALEIFTNGVVVLYLFAAACTFLLLDQWSKRVVLSGVPAWCIFVGPVVRIRCVRSMKALYHRNSARFVLAMVWLLALISAIILHRSGLWFQSNLSLLALGAALGGAAGNLLDIMRRHHVIDFIDLRWWPVFNLADVAIVLGLVMAFWRSA